MTLPDRFWAKVDKGGPDGCWLWTAARSGAGYGVFKINGRAAYAHRLAFEDGGRPLVAGEKVDHRCYVPACVNPAHLQAKTHRENLENRRGPNAGSSSGVRGVTRTGGRWRARAASCGVEHSGGRYDTKAEAEAAAVALRNRLMTNNLRDREEDVA